MKIDRRTLLKSATFGAGSAMLGPFARTRSEAAEPLSSPKRVIFFVIGHGFVPLHSRPEDIGFPSDKEEDDLDRIIDTDLTSLTLPDYIDPLEPYKDRLTIVQGLSGKHVRPFHGAPYGALGGFLKSRDRAAGQTIDCAISELLPAVMPHLGIAWSGLRGSAVSYSSSSWAADKPAPLFRDPNLACMNIFGSVLPGEIGVEYEADTALLEFARDDAARMSRRLSSAEREKFSLYLESFEEAISQRQELFKMSDVLRTHVPTIGEQFTNPRFETDWHSASLDVMLGALKAGVTNVVTICVGDCVPSRGFNWREIGLSGRAGQHLIGHGDQLDDDWLKIRRYSMEVLVRIMESLDSVPEGDGTMMDNTLIVYTSDSGSKQHSWGDRWPFLLLGNLGGTIRSGRFIHYPIGMPGLSRTINALYCTLLHALGDQRDRFNLEGPLARLERPGPLPELLA